MPASSVALGYNRLTSLPKGFVAMSRIRYLNLRSNLFSHFPPVVRLISRATPPLLLTLPQLISMPSLEVLDISRNRIKRLPPDPGALRNLKVRPVTRRATQPFTLA